MNARGLRPLAALVALSGVLVAGCGAQTDGTPKADAAASAEFRAFGVWPLADDPDVSVDEKADADVNRVAALAVEDTSEFWEYTDGAFRAPTRIVARSAPDPSSSCYADLDIARVCTGGGLGWNTASLTQLRDDVGDLGVLVVIAHEMGHHVQMSNGQKNSEREADCLAGMYLKSVVERTQEPRRFTATKQAVLDAADDTFAWSARAFPSDVENGDTPSDRGAALVFGYSADQTKCRALYGAR